MASGAGEAGVLFEDLGLADHVEAGVQDDDTVQGNGDAAAVSPDLLFIPLAERLAVAGARRDGVVDRAVILLGTDLAGVPGVAIVEDLDFHALVGSVAFVGGADADTVVGAGGEHEL